jgi:chemotaxis protein CheD
VKPERGQQMAAAAVVDWFPYATAGGVPNAYLHAGHLFVSGTPCRVSTILGSCVSVALFDPVAQVGGLNHFLLPVGPEQAAPSARFGTVAVPWLIEALVAAGAQRRSLHAKVFGGACVLRAFRSEPSPRVMRQAGSGSIASVSLPALRAGGGNLGQKNVQVAKAILLAEGIPIVAEDVNGERGRKLIFQTHDGAAWVRSL